jgi:spermidine synthase
MTSDPEPTEQKLKIEPVSILSVVSIGVSSIITQIVLLREFLSVFYGNELVIGIILANWMVITAIGSFIGKYISNVKHKVDLLIISLVLISILPVITVFLVEVLRNAIFPVGTMISLVEIFYSSFVVLIPYCFITGMTFTLFAQLLSERYDTNLISLIYSWESFGGVIGGFIFSFVLIYTLTTFDSLIILMIVNLATTFLFTLLHGGRISRYIILSALLLIPTGAIILDLDKTGRRYLFPNQKLVYHQETPYGKLTVTEETGQHNFYENNNLLFSTNDPILNEEAAHYALVQHRNPRKVLLISGGISGTIPEILKYNIDKITYVEINPRIIEIGRKYTTDLRNDRIEIINQDARLFLKNTIEKYDVVLINLPDPSTIQINRFYTDEFFKELKNRLTAESVISISLSSSADYMSPEARRIKSSIYNTLKQSYKNILIIPGYKDYFIASDGTLSIDIPTLIAQKGLNNKYVNSFYLDKAILSQRSEFVANNLDITTAVNKDFFPISYYQQLMVWLTYFHTDYWLIAIVAGLIFVFLIVQFNTISFGIFTAGFSAMAVEILFLITFQVIYGYVYHVTGIIITIFMAGLATGSRFYLKVFPASDIRSFINTQFILFGFSLLLPVFFIFLKQHSSGIILIHGIFFSLTFFIAVLIGMEFSIASRLKKGNISSIVSNLYSIDLIGSAFGALLTTAYLIPRLGINNVYFLIAILNLISGSVLFIRRNKY